MIHQMVTSDLYTGQPFLFSDQFDHAGWLFMAQAGGNRRVLAAADLENIKIDMYK